MTTRDESDSPPAISVRRLAHSFKNHRALQDVTFSVEPRSIHGFVGPNGAGKTTTLKILATLLRPQVGRVLVCGSDVVHQRKWVRSQIGFMPDHFSMYRQMTVYEYLDFFAAAYGLSLSARNQIIEDVLALTDMNGRRDDLIRTLSRGMQQRVSLARVLVNDPAVLLLDEPASGLDPRSRIELMAILRELRSMGKTIFISSHILSELADLCDSVSIIDRGHIRYSGPMRELLKTQGATRSYRLVVGEEADGNLEEALLSLPGVLEVTRDEGEPRYHISFDPESASTRDILGAVLADGTEVVSFEEERRHLNEAFMDLTDPGVRS